MPLHVIVDGSNLATEGRSVPSLNQLNDAVLAYIEEHPTALVTVVVDATFGHRIDAKETAAFDEAVANNEIVAPPAGAIGRGDAFVLSIANKVNGTIISNDSFQEFHGQYTWLFDEGRLVGGKPVPHVGWVFVERLPVRGPTSRKAVQESKRKTQRSSAGTEITTPKSARSSKASVAASGPPPVPKAPPPGARLRKGPAAKDAAAAVTEPPKSVASGANDLLPFLTFVEHHPPGASVNAIVESYSSHGAYVSVGDVKGYVPLRLMASPAPRSAREFMTIGESVTLVVESFGASRRSIDLGLPTMVAVRAPSASTKRRRQPATVATTDASLVEPLAAAPAKAAKGAAAPKKAAKKAAPAKRAAAPKQTAAPKAPAAVPSPAKKAAARQVPAKPAAVQKAAPARPAAKPAVKPSAPAKPAAKPVAATKGAAPAKKAVRPKRPAAAAD